MPSPIGRATRRDISLAGPPSKSATGSAGYPPAPGKIPCHSKEFRAFVIEGSLRISLRDILRINTVLAKKMRHLIATFIFVLASKSLHANGNPELTVIEREIRSLLDGSDWEISRDPSGLTLIKRGVTLLNPMSAALSGPDDDIWLKYSFKSDYRITVTVGPKITDDDYSELIRMRDQWRKVRRPVIPESPDRGAPGPIQLPMHHIGWVSVYVDATDDRFEVRPASAITTRGLIMQVLESTCQKYEDKPEQAGTGQPATRPESKSEGGDKPQPESEGRSR